MARELTIKCDCCGAIKGKTNHWWMASINSSDSEYPNFRMYPACGAMASSQKPTLDLCSESCVTKTVSQWLQKTREQQA